MNKVGILTFHWANNYGAVLQTYALQEILRELNQHVEVINFVPPILDAVTSPTLSPNKLGKKYSVLDLPLKTALRCMAGEVIYYIPNIAEELKRTASLNEFRRNILNVSDKVIKNLDQLKYKCQYYNAVVVGSDVIWHPGSLKFSNYAYLLPFSLKRVFKIAFSASIAAEIEDIPIEIINLYKKSLHDFLFISIRESIHARWLSHILNRRVYHTLDPTLLVTRDAFEEISRPCKLIDDNYILFYNLHSETLHFLKDLKKYLEISCVIIHKKPLPHEKIHFNDHKQMKIKSFYQLGPREFIDLVRRAEFVITEGYHGLTLSLIFEKPVIVLISSPASKIKSRVEDLTKYLELNGIVIRSRSDAKKALRAEIDYRDVRSRLAVSRKFALDLLKEVLSSSS